MDYKIDNWKLEAVTRIMNRDTDPEVTEEVVAATICSDWHEGQEHQDWIDGAGADEIADWLATFYL